MNPLTELQALEVLDKVRLEFKGTPQDHVIIAQSIEKVKELIAKIKELEEKISEPKVAEVAEI